MISIPIYPGLKVIGNKGADAYVYTRQGTRWTVSHFDEEFNEVGVIATDFYDEYRRIYPDKDFEWLYDLINRKERASAFTIHRPDFRKRFDIDEISNSKVASHVLERHDWQ